MICLDSGMGMVNLQPFWVLNSAKATKNRFCPGLHFLHLLCSFITFYLSIAVITAPQMTRTLYDDLERRTLDNSLLLTILSSPLSQC
jgi:hypothetical protein